MPAAENGDSNTGRVVRAVDSVLERDGARRAAEREIEQVHSLSKWNLGIISALLVLFATWLWQIAATTNRVERSVDKQSYMMESLANSTADLKNTTKTNMEQVQTLIRDTTDMARRIATLEGNAAQGARYTAKDGEQERMAREATDQVLFEKVKTLDVRIHKIEEDKSGTRK